MQPAPPWHSSLVARMVLLYSLLTAGVVAVLGWLSFAGSRDALVRSEAAAMRHAAETLRLKVQATVGNLERDLVQLSLSPTLREFIKSEGSPQEPRWRSLVEDAFRAAIEGKPTYFQVRLIGIGDGGRELIRLDNRDGFIVATPPERLQQKAGRDYFAEALRTPGGAVYLSQINLNRDFGIISEPHVPTLRALKIVETGDGTLHSIVAINLDLRPLFAELERLAGTGTQLALAVSEGGYILHQQPGRVFAAELGEKAEFSSDFAAAAEIPAESAGWRLTRRGEDDVLLARFALAPGGGRELLAALSRPADSLVAGLRAARDRALRYTALAALGSLLLVVAFARLLAGRLRRLTRAVAEYEVGSGTAALPPPGGDEVGLLAARFRELDTRATAALKAREDFLAVMSHEIRTPMNAVLGVTRALEASSPAPQQAALLRSLGTAARGLMALLDGALDYSKLRAGRATLNAAPFSLPSLLRDVAATHRAGAVEKGVALELEAAPGLPEWVQGDAVRLGQVLHNLVGNAVKFTAAGSIHIAAESEAGTVKFRVSDSGMGIPAELLPRVFEPFGQAGPEVAARFGGTGLGLGITRELVRLMGGELAVESEPGRGSVFHFSLPLPPVAAPAPASAAKVPDLAGLRLLYVEDVPSNCEVMALTLDGTRAELVTAPTGAAALELLGREKFGGILLDLQLPDCTGTELAPKLRALSPAPIIAVTAQATPSALAECLAAGMAAVVTKPVDPAQLWAALKGVRGRVSFAQVEGIFGATPEKLRKVLRMVAEEFAKHEATLREAVARQDCEAVRRVKHAMHTAVEQFELHELREQLGVLAAGDFSSAERVFSLVQKACASLLARAA